MKIATLVLLVSMQGGDGKLSTPEPFQRLNVDAATCAQRGRTIGFEMITVLAQQRNPTSVVIEYQCIMPTGELIGREGFYHKGAKG